MSMPHVLRVTPHFYWPQLAEKGWPVKFDAIGGMQTQIYQQTLALSKHNIRQTVLTLKLPGVPPIWQIDERTKVIGVRVPVLPLRSRLRGMVDLNLSWALGVMSAVRKMAEIPDVIHSHWSGVALPPWLSEHLQRRLRRPSIATVHCSSLATYHAMSRLDSLQHWFARRIEAQAVAALDAVIVLTPRAASALTGAVTTRAGRIHIIPDCIDRVAFAGSTTVGDVALFRRSYGVPAGQPVIGYVGRIAREKGWRGLLDMAMMPELAEAFFLICGDGNERDLLETEITRRGLGPRFAVTGYLPNEQVAVALKVCNVVVLPSRHEEFGSILLEAMSVGVPSVAFSIGGIPHVLADGRAGRLVDDGDYRGMALAVVDLLTNPEQTAQMIATAFEHVDRCFSRVAAGRAMADLYCAMVAGGPKNQQQKD